MYAVHDVIRTKSHSSSITSSSGETNHHKLHTRALLWYPEGDQPPKNEIQLGRRRHEWFYSRDLTKFMVTLTNPKTRIATLSPKPFACQDCQVCFADLQTPKAPSIKEVSSHP